MTSQQSQAEDRPTLFFIMNYGSSIRNLVGGGVLDALVKQGFRLVLFGINEKDRAAVEAEMPGDCILEELGPTPFPRVIKWLITLRTFVWRSKINYGELLQKRGKNRNLSTYIQYALGYLLRPIPASWWQKANVLLAEWPRGKALIQQYQPQAVLISNAMGPENCAIDFSRRRGIYTACVLESWDNLTNRGALHGFPHDLFVWNELVKRQAIRYHQYKDENVQVTGIPSFDLYARKERYPDEVTWRKENDLPESGPIILYSLSSKHIYPDEDIVIQHLVSARDAGDLPPDAHILVRFHPRDHEEMQARYADIPGISLQSPGLAFKHRINDPSMGSPMMLAATVHYASVVVNVFSSMCLDSLCNDTPVVVVNYDASDRPFSESVKGYLVFEHIKDLLAFDAVLVAESPTQMIEQVKAALDDPEIHLTQRQACVAAEAYGLDGKASKRTASLIAQRIAQHRG